MVAPAALAIVPVIDVMGGRVVHAVRGERRAYRPIESALVAGDDPVAVARALLRAVGTSTGGGVLYLADLDAIQGAAAQHEVVAALLEALPGVELWVDAGFADADAVRGFAGRLRRRPTGWRPVYGSETLSRNPGGAPPWQDDARAILSLDHRGGPLDPAGCWQRPEQWPATLIVMTLERVGSGGGPDLATFAAQRRRAGGRRCFGAGGIRDARDLDAAAAAGADGWLVASALHDGRLRPAAGG
ncbi:HisA/HisF-related TIM barrel protein [Calidifontimicrobium sp. SYSU G02091]|uniref:HisA/HisF-related TIM barrel protein n=1 Tax=Calidifontimicrobium sp. SYSU G02091 TaxID=2926421 RepID=UPI001F5359DA|nr:HisA/HisF-related TIM barrel protein [Calidifontimicrobium sp. SYSU G02091]MCI1192550.1 HisA/HisF-related TIM barrel protein [Calidifontimicrobium sp. SYSU G02091]